MNRALHSVNWFEIPVHNIDRAKYFYECVLGYPLKLNETDDLKRAWFPKDSNGLGSSGTLVEGNGYKPSKEGTLVYLHVENIEKTLDKIADNGGTIINPKTAFGEHGSIAHFEDLEGNKVALHSNN